MENVLLFFEQHVCSQQEIVWGSWPSKVLPEFLLESYSIAVRRELRILLYEKPLKAESDLHVLCFSWKSFVSLLYFKQQALKNVVNNCWGQVISIYFADFTAGQSLQRLFYIHCTKLSGRCFDLVCEQIILIFFTWVLIVGKRHY